MGRELGGNDNIYPQLNLVYTAEVSRRYGDKGIVCTAVNPGKDVQLASIQDLPTTLSDQATSNPTFIDTALD